MKHSRQGKPLQPNDGRPLDLNADSWPPLDITAGPLLDLSDGLQPLDITAGPALDLSAGLGPLDLNAEKPAGRPKKRRTGKPLPGPGKALESAENGLQ